MLPFLDFNQITVKSSIWRCLEQQWWGRMNIVLSTLFVSIKTFKTGLFYLFSCPVQFCSVAQSCPTLWGPMDCSTPHQLPEFTQTHVHWVGDAIQPSHPLSSSSLLPLNLSQSIRVFSNESALHIRWPKYWSFSFSISPSHEYSGLISFRMDLLDLLAVQGTLKSLLQHHSSKASILRRSAFFTVQLSYPYMTTRKTIALTKRTSVVQWQLNELWTWVIVFPFVLK